MPLELPGVFPKVYTCRAVISSSLGRLEVPLPDLSFTSAPDSGQTFNVGDRVEVYCDHDNSDEDRVRDWLAGVVVQADTKMVAVQFQENVYLTDGWMVPDHVLWCPQDSANLRFYKKHRARSKPKTKSGRK